MAKYEIKDGVGIIPEGTKRIEDEAFETCEELTSVTIPDSVTEIGDYAFIGCTGLTSITIPDSVTEIGDDAFSGCTGLTSIVVAEGNKKYDSRGNCNAIVETASNCLMSGCKNTVIPDSVTEIGDDAFIDCTSLTSVTFPDSVTKIGDCAFTGCTGLTSITIPDSVTEIGSAFSGCTGLTSVVVAYGNKIYDSRGNCNAIIETESDRLIMGCKNTVIPDSVTEIGEFAFAGSGLTSIVIPDSVTEIGSNAFYVCTGLTSINIPKSVTEIRSAFSGCTNLASITVDAENKFYSSPDNCNAIVETASNCLISGCKNTVIPDSVTEIGEFAFAGSGLTSIVIPDSVTEIGYDAFSGCSGLKTAVIKGKSTDFSSMFKDCVSLESVTLPVGIKVFDEWTFDGCKSLKAIFVPAKKGDYYRHRIPESLHDKIVELPPEKKTKK